MPEHRTAIVPPKPVVIERRVMRRRKTRRAALLCFGASCVAAWVLPWPPKPPSIPFIVLGAVALASGVAAVVFRLTERPTEVIVRKVSGRGGPVIH